MLSNEKLNPLVTEFFIRKNKQNHILLVQNHSFLAIDATLASDNPSSFRKNLLERI